MQQHTDHRSAAEHLASVARKHSLATLASAADAHAKASAAGHVAHGTGDTGKQAAATLDILTTGGDALRAFIAAQPAPPEVEEAGRAVLRTLGNALAASV